jgi:SOS-response transcriptional repressor LexA
MSGAGAFSWNSELPSGRNPYWIRDEALSGLGLHVGDAVSVDTAAEASAGDLVVVEVELEEDSLRMARRYVPTGDGRVRLESVGGSMEAIEVPGESVMVMGVIVARVRLRADAPPLEEPIP